MAAPHSGLSSRSSLSVVVLPFPAVTPPPISVTIHAFPSPVIILSGPASLVSLIPVVVILPWHYTTMVFRESVAGINAMPAVVASAIAFIELSVTGSGEARGQRRERESQQKLFRFRLHFDCCSAVIAPGARSLMLTADLLGRQTSSPAPA
jgi:hypothetical protein